MFVIPVVVVDDAAVVVAAAAVVTTGVKICDIANANRKIWITIRLM